MSSARDLGDAVRLAQTRMTSPVQGVVFVILAAASIWAAVVVEHHDPEFTAVTAIGGLVASFLIASAIKVANQWDRGVVLRLGQSHDHQSGRG